MLRTPAHRQTAAFLFFASALALSSAGCGSDGSSGSAAGLGAAGGLQLVSSDPADGAQDVALDRVVRLTFGQPVDAATAASGVRVELNGSPLAVAPVASGAEVAVAPPGPAGAWPQASDLEVHVDSSLRSTSGLAAATATVTFRTRSAPPPAAATLPLPGGPRAAAASVRLADGRVLTCGGDMGPTLATADVYDPETGAFAPAAPMRRPRWGHSATLLPDGRVLVAGGFDAAGGPHDTIEVYAPARDAWRELPATLARTRVFHRAFVLRSGRVAIVGGEDTFAHGGGTPVTTVELIDPRDETTSVVAGLNVGPGDWTQLPDGRLLHLGAQPTVYDLDASPVTSAPTANAPAAFRLAAAIETLPDGRLFLAGGLSGFGSGTTTIHAEVDLFDPATLQFRPGPDLRQPRFGARAARLIDGRVAVVGGGTPAPQGPPGAADQVEVYDPFAGVFDPAYADDPREAVSAVALDRGGLLVTGSRSSHVDPTTARPTATRIPAGALARPGSAPAVEGVAPQGGYAHAHPAGTIEVRFSEPMDPATLTPASVTLEDLDRGVAVPCAVVPAPVGRACHLVPDAPLRPGRPYAVEVRAGAASAAGVPLDRSRGAVRVRLRTARGNPLGDGGLIVVEKPTGGAPLLYRAVDRDGDGDVDDPGELSVAFTPPASANVQEPAMGADGAIYLPDAEADLLWRLVDRNGDGDADDAGEATVFFDGTSPLGPILTSPASAAVAPDGAVFLANNGSGGGQDFVLRLVDADGDGDALDAGEAAVFNPTDYAGAIWGLEVDAYGLAWHTVTGSAGNLLVGHGDANGDGDSEDPGERAVVYAAPSLVTDVALTPGQQVGVWAGFASGAARLEWVTQAGQARSGFSDPAGIVGNAASVSGYADGRLRVADDGNDRLWELRDLNADGDYDDVDEVRVLFTNAGGTLARPFYSAAGIAPPAPRALAAPAAGDQVVAGVARPFAAVRVEVRGSAATVQADPRGVFSATLAAPLASGDQVALEAEGLGGRSPARVLRVP